MKPLQYITKVTVDETAIHISGSLRQGGSPKLLEDLIAAVEDIEGTQVIIDLSEVAELDSLGASLLAELEVKTRLTGKSIRFIRAAEEIEHGLEQYYYPTPEIKFPSPESQHIVTLGERAFDLFRACGNLLLIISESVYWSIVALWNPSGHRKAAVISQALAIGVGALPVIAVISFLIGIVLALQSAEQLRQFGANIFVADLVVISMAREMGPLMTAILLAGRSGAAIAAEISSMTVNEETDALVTMALKPIRYVVVPKILGIIITAPLLSIMATVIGIFGGFIIAVNTLDLTPQSFLLEAQKALYLKDIITGLIKSVVFAWLIVILAAFFGFRVTGGPEGVGRATTKAVVASIFAVIVADSVLGILFYL